MPERTRVVIVGGGITGLATAHRLEDAVRQGQMEVALLEAGPRLGGKLDTLYRSGFVAELGPDSLLTRKPVAMELVRAAGLEDQLVASPPKARPTLMYMNGRLRALPAGMMAGIPSRLGPLLATPLLTPAAKIRALGDLAMPRTLSPGVDTSFGEFLSRRLGREVVTHLAEPLVAGIYGAAADRLGLDAIFPNLRGLEARYRSLIVGIMAQARSARQKERASSVGRPSDRPPGPKTPPVMALRGGFASLVGAIEEHTIAAGIDVRTCADVVKLTGTGTDKNTEYRLSLEDGSVVRAHHVVLSIPAYAAATLVQDLDPVLAAELRDIPYSDAALVLLAYPEEALKHPLEGSGFFVPRDAGLDIAACTFVSTKWPHTAPQGHLLFRVSLTLPDADGDGSDPVTELTDEALIRRAHEGLRETLGLTNAPEWAVPVRIPRAIPRYGVGHRDRLSRLDAALLCHGGLYLAGSAYRGMSVPDCMEDGRTAAEAILKARHATDIPVPSSTAG